MADRQLHRYGEENPVRSPVNTAEVVEIGDMVMLEVDDVRSASTETWDTDIATTQEAFHDHFLGVSAQRSLVGDTDEIRVATEGVFEFDCVAASFEIGDLVGTAKQAGDNIESQKVVAVATSPLAVGRVAKRYGSNTTKVLVRIVSVVMLGGDQVMA